jgi:hypothetical protein
LSTLAGRPGISVIGVVFVGAFNVDVEFVALLSINIEPEHN